MYSQPPGLNRPVSGGTSVDLTAYLQQLLAAVGFAPDEESVIGRPGSYTGTVRCGGDTYRRAVALFAAEVMSKFDDKEPSSDEAKTRKALEKFHEAEALCAQTNQRFEKYFYGHRPLNEDVARVICRAREKIWRLLGDLDPSELSSGFTFTSGGSVKLPRARGTAVHKYSTAVETTESTLSLLSGVFHQIPAWGGDAEAPDVVKVLGNKLQCVPKNYKTHRMIAGEPSGSMYIQKGLHTALRRRLLKVGVDLDNQKANQDWAQFGSASGLVATIDMSMASDTVSKTVVEWFLGLNPDWLEWMSLTRSPMGWFDSDRIIYRKFSSMGNAYTFELETLLFWALATAVCDVQKADRRFVSVYGDDVVIPTRVVPLFLDVLEECGFIPNREKSFWESHPNRWQQRYRESCGKHYFCGWDVTPVYVRSKPETLLDLFKLCNNGVRWLTRLDALPDAPDLSEAWRVVRALRSLAPRVWQRPRIPDGFGDGAFIGTFDEATPRRLRGKRKYWEGWLVEVLTERFDTALGVDDRGWPLVRTRGRLRTYQPRDKRACIAARQVVRDVTLRGYLLSSLERLEKSPRAWHRTVARMSPRMAALAAASQVAHADNAKHVYSFDSEERGINLPMSRQVGITSMVVPQW